MSRNVAEPDEEQAAAGANTFATPPPDDYEGRLICFEVVRLGDHAHVNVSTGRQHANGPRRTPTFHKGDAGRIVMQWEDWLHWRAALDSGPPWQWIVEVEHPRPGQIQKYAG